MKSLTVMFQWVQCLIITQTGAVLCVSATREMWMLFRYNNRSETWPCNAKIPSRALRLIRPYWSASSSNKRIYDKHMIKNMKITIIYMHRSASTNDKLPRWTDSPKGGINKTKLCCVTQLHFSKHWWLHRVYGFKMHWNTTTSKYALQVQGSEHKNKQTCTEK